MLKQFQSHDLDYRLVEYVDITKKLRDNSGHPEKSQLIFVIEKASEVLEEVFNEMSLEKVTTL